MVAATQARSLAITINDNDWSQNLVSFEIGFESYQQGTGLILKKGTLVLCNIRGDSRPIDPIDQNDFEVGNDVCVQIFDADTLLGVRKPHPLGYQLKILAPPEVRSISQGSPEVEGNLIVTIPVGCNLAYSRTQQSDSDQTGVTLGSFIRVSEVVGNLLNAAGINNSKIQAQSPELSPDVGTSVPSFPGSVFDSSQFPSSVTVFGINKLFGFIGWPYSKNGGGFTDLAGEFAYSGDYGLFSGEVQPNALFCNFDNKVTLKLIPQLKRVGVYYHEYTKNVISLGVNDRLYQRQLDLIIAPGTVEISGIWRQVQDIANGYPFTDTITNSDGSSTETTFYYAEEESIPNGLDLFSFTPSTGTVPRPSTVQGGGYIYQGQSIISRQTLAENFGGTSTAVTGREYQFSFYDNDRYLNYEITVRYANAGTLYPSGWEDSDSEDIITAATNYKDTLVPSEIVITVFRFTDNYVTEKQTLIYSNFFLIDRNADFIADFLWAFNKASIPGQGGLSSSQQNMAVKQNKVETWREVNDLWIYTVKDFSPAIVNNPTLFDKDRVTKLALSPKPVIPSTTTIKARDTQPPAIVYWEGKFKIKENQVNGSRAFGNGESNKNIRLQSSFWFPFVTESSGGDDITSIDEREPLDQPDAFARIEGEIINGRQYQYLIECEPSIFEKVYEPLTGVSVVEINTTKYFLADALTWYHTPTETYVAFAGIFAGSSPTPPPGYAYPETPGDITPPSDPGDPGTIPESFPNQIISTPSPTATIDIAGVAFIDTITGSAER